VLPIRRAGAGAPIALLVAGVSPRLVLTDAYRMFFELVAAAVGTAVTNACALEDERQKSQVLAELDRAKTAFFSSVSHEFRTPLTLILGPLEDALADAGALPAALRGSLDTMHRNALRLLRLVNTLLDFSRIEAGRLRAIYEPVDLSSETLQLASVFRAATEHAGLELVVDCPALPEPVFIDREMWEKIVFNLLSNALKHTARGAITVSQRWDGERVTLRVADTGVGIAEHELPRVFERFHRVHGAWSRSHEGTGIGLALVRELARALGGDVEIASRVGIGTTVSVMLRTGSAHLPADHVAAGSPRALERIGTAFVEEAVRWNPDPAPAEAQAPAARGRPDGAPRIVLADDNADMRDYVSHLLADHFEIEAVADGAAALDAIRARIPDLVLSDVMMPRLDGLGLVAALRAEPKTRTLPVILLSARAGTEASTEGIDAGADDYLIKPFAARELVARVRTHIALARTRRAWAAELERANRELEAFSYSVSHDLSAPLRGIANFAQLLLDDDAPQDLDDRRAAVQRIASNAARMRAIIEDLLALSQVSSGELRRESVNLTAIARRVLANLRLRDPSRVVEVTVSEGMTATGDSRLVQIALENLLANAWKFTSKRDAAKIAIDCEAGVFAIHDNGAGFDMAASDHLFEPFQRLHASADFEGTGIGLAIVRRIVERHGGQVWAHGVVDGGATVRFTLRGDP
jgi:signal transduction histidine kinase